MNNTCPSCGALYNVTTKDIGRRLMCKKCNSALAVTDTGLVVDETNGAAAPAGNGETMEPVARSKRNFTSGFNSESLAPIGGIPGLLFAVGVFFVVFFTFMQVLGAASNTRAEEYEKKVMLEEEIKVRKLLPKGKKDRADLNDDEKKKYDDEKKKVEDEYTIAKKEAAEDKRSTEIGNKRSRLYEGYGTMFGFLLVAFGCLGFLRAHEAMLLRIVAGVILTGMVLGLFRITLGTGAAVGAGINIG